MQAIAGLHRTLQNNHLADDEYQATAQIVRLLRAKIAIEPIAKLVAVDAELNVGSARAQLTSVQFPDTTQK